jgi:uncharacterized protein YrrD
MRHANASRMVPALNPVILQGSKKKTGPRSRAPVRFFPPVSEAFTGQAMDWLPPFGYPLAFSDLIGRVGLAKMMHFLSLMLRSLKDLRQFTIRATDGVLGNVHDGYFDKRNWTVPYVVAQFPEVPARRRLVDSASLESSASNPVLHRVERATKEIAEDTGADKTGDSHLAALSALIGYTVESEEGEIGHVDDLLIDDRTWAIRYLVVNAEKWCPDKHVWISPEWVIPATRDGSNTLFSFVVGLHDDPARSASPARRMTSRDRCRVDPLSDSTRPARFLAAPTPSPSLA